MQIFNTKSSYFNAGCRTDQHTVVNKKYREGLVITILKYNKHFTMHYNINHTVIASTISCFGF